MKSRKTRIETTNPLIVPIVIYTGNKHWNVPTNFSHTQPFNLQYKQFNIKQLYKLIDINEYSTNKLKIFITKSLICF